MTTENDEAGRKDGTLTRSVGIQRLVIWRDRLNDPPPPNTHTAILIVTRGKKPRPGTAFFDGENWKVYDAPTMAGFDAWKPEAIRGWYEIPKP